MLVRVEMIPGSSAGFGNRALPNGSFSSYMSFSLLIKMLVCLDLRMSSTDRVLVDGRDLRRVGAP